MCAVAMIRRADQNEAARDAMVLDLGDLFRQGEAIKAAAKDQAAAILAAAKAERARLIAGAVAEGRAQGLAKGLEEGRAKGQADGVAQAVAAQREALEAVEKAWLAALESFSAARDQMLMEARKDVLQLALLIARRVTHRAIEVDESVVEDQLAATLALVSRPTRLVITVSPDDLERARGALPVLLERFGNAAHATVTGDASLARGSCVARAEAGGEIDASIGTQLDRIAAALVPGRERPGLALAGSAPEIVRGDAA
jgi:flagellar biosynthesis/type III secretory pathway protein FliH